MKKGLILIVLFLLYLPSIAQDYDDKVVEMMEVMGAKQNFDLVANQLLQMQKAQYPNISEAFWDRFFEAMRDSAEVRLMNDMVPVYAKYLSEKDVDNIIAFYESESGRKLIRNLPGIMTESMKIGRQLGLEVGEMIGEAIEQEKLEKFNMDFETCELAMTGEFYSHSNDMEFTYSRTKKRQIETAGNFVFKQSIEWLSDSRYKLTLISSNDPNSDKKTAKSVIVNIISCNEDGYDYLAKQEGSDYIMEGELKKKVVPQTKE